MTLLYMITINLTLQLNLDFSFTVLPCPPGYELQTYLDGNNSVSCVCSGARDNQFAVLDCVDERRAIIIRVSKPACRY